MNLYQPAPPRSRRNDMRRVGSPQYRRVGGTPCRRAITPRTASARSLSGYTDETARIRSPSAAAPVAATHSQRHQPSDQLRVNEVNAVNVCKRPVRLVRIEKVRDRLCGVSWAAGRRRFDET
jgi:hypothetical protein